MNNVKFAVITIGPSPVEIEGILFSNSIFIKIVVDGQEVIIYDYCVVFSELELSSKASGKYLIFVPVCGIADEGCWEPVEVAIRDSDVLWRVWVADDHYKFRFDKTQLFDAISVLKSQILALEKRITLEPRSPMFPESWEPDDETRVDTNADPRQKVQI